MNILIVNWTWYPSGGDWTYVENISRLYEEKGHNIIPFSMKDDRNLPSPFSKYFIENINYKNMNRLNLISGVKVMMNSIFSFESQKKLEWLLSEVQIDFVHINVIHHYITPAILKILKKKDLPVIWTLHEYTPLCPDSIFFNKGKVCEKCEGGEFFHCITNACKKGSYLASTVAALENYVHKYLNYYDYVDYFICPSKFHFNKFKSYDFFNDKLVQIYHGYDYSEIERAKSVELAETSKYIVFVGRLEEIKGIKTLLKAMLYCKHIELKIVGTGTQEAEMKLFKDTHQQDNVSFLGKRSRQETLGVIRGGAFLVCPSECYEVLGFTVVEAMAMGRAVIGAAIGAIPEMIIDQQTGLLFSPGDAEQLAEKINFLYNNDLLNSLMGAQAEIHINKLVNNEQHYAGLKDLIPML